MTGLMTALISVLSQIAIPVPIGVPITLQTLAVALCGYLLGLKYGTASTFLYIILGCIGVPVFSHFQGGIHYVFASPTGGFILGFIFISVLTGCASVFKWRKNEKLYGIIFGFVGVILCHLCGAMQYASIGGVSFTVALITVSVPFLLKDLISVVLAYFLSLKIKKIM